MGKCLNIGSLVLGTVILFGCANQNTGLVASVEPSPSILPAKTGTLTEHNPVKGKLLVQKAKSAIGTPYILGGTSPGGFDCSGLVQWTYNSLGVALPRTAREQASVGKKVHDVKDMREGDIVAFRHPKRGYHTGIYVGDGKFVHSPRKRSTVRINSLSDPYFRSTLLGARRVDLNGSELMLASSTAQLEKMVAEKSHLAISERNIEKIRAYAKKHGKTDKELKAKKSRRQIAASLKKDSRKKSTIASQARKIQSVKTLTGKSKANGKNTAAHASLAKASKNTTSRLAASKKHIGHSSVKLNSSRKNLAQATQKTKNHNSRTTSVANAKNGHKSVSMLTRKHSGRR